FHSSTGQRSKTFNTIMPKLRPFKRETKGFENSDLARGDYFDEIKSEPEMTSKCFDVDKFFLKTN
ncbi:hypothetical protein LDENG_00006660, partial [Lucifuga dentata]